MKEKERLNKMLQTFMNAMYFKHKNNGLLTFHPSEPRFVLNETWNLNDSQICAQQFEILFEVLFFYCYHITVQFIFVFIFFFNIFACHNTIITNQQKQMTVTQKK